MEALVNLHKDRERARELRAISLERMAVARCKKGKGNDRSEKKGHKKKISAVSDLVFDQSLLARLRANAEFFIDEGEDDILDFVKTADSYVELAALFSQAASERGVYLSLCWPVGFEWVGLAHVLASHVSMTDSLGQKGLRMALYPALDSNYGRYRRTRLPMQGFLREARDAAAETMDLSLRHLVLMGLNDLEGSDDPRRHPALRNAISIFDWVPVDSKWNLRGKGFFSDVRLALHHAPNNTAYRKKLTADYAEVMADPSKVREALFRIKRNIKPSEARQVLLRRELAADLVVIDARRDLLEGIPSWRNTMEILVKQFGKLEDGPSLVLLTDDVTISRVLLSKLKAGGKKGKKAAPTMPVYLHHWLRTEAQLWCREIDQSPHYAPLSSVNVRVTAAKSLTEIGKINKIAKMVNESSPELARELRRAGGFLRRLVSMPVGQRPLQQQLHKEARQMRLSEGTRLLARYNWSDYVREMRARLDGTSAGDSPTLDRALKLAQNILVDITDSTGVQRELLDVLVEKVIEEKRTLVLLEDKRLIPSVHAIIQADLGEAQEGLVQIQANVDSACSSDVDALVIAGARKDRVMSLLVTNGLPADFSLILDAYTGWQVQKDLEILECIGAYAPIRPRIEELLYQIRPHIQSYLQLAGDLEIPAEIAEDVQGAGGHYDHGIAYANIHLDGYGILPVGKASTLIKYNPAQFSPFLATMVDDLTEGDRLVILDDEQRERIANLLRVQTNRLIAKSEDVLKVYFQQALAGIKEHYQQPHSAKRARAILARMGQVDADLAREIPEERVAWWVRHIEKFDPEQATLCEGELKSGSPRHKEEFLLFAEALGMHSLVAANYWQEGIRPLRVRRILEGRKLGRHIQRVLTGYFNLAELGLGREEIRALFDLARNRVYPISMIICINEGHGHKESRS